MSPDAREWLTDEVREAIRRRAEPWTADRHTRPVIEHYDWAPAVDHQQVIASNLAAQPDGAVLVAALPPDSGVIEPFEGCWTILHERIVENGPSVLIVWKMKTIDWVDKAMRRTTSRPRMFFFPKVWRLGDTYSLLPVLDELKKKIDGSDVEFYFENDVRRIYPDAKIISPEEARVIPWDGVLNQCSFWSEITAELANDVHYYERPVEIAKRMGWLPRSLAPAEVPKPFPISHADETWARSHVPHCPGTYVAIVQKTTASGRDWPIEKSIELTRWLDECGIPTVIIGMNGEDPAVDGYTFKKCRSLIGEGTVAQVAAVIAGARLLISPDTGLLHLACGHGIKSIGLFGPTVYEDITKPPVIGVKRGDGGCSGCYRGSKIQWKCGATAECLDAISVEDVARAVSEVLGIEYWKKAPEAKSRPENTWLTEEVEEKIRRRVNPWTLTGAPVIEHFEMLPQANHQRLIEMKLANAKDGTILIGALPPKTRVIGPFKGCWTILHGCVSSYGPSFLVVRKGLPIRRKYRIQIPEITQVGDTYTMLSLFGVLRKNLHNVEFHFENDLTRVYPDAIVTPKEQGDKIAWDGVLTHSFMMGAIGYNLYRKVHFYDLAFEIAKRMNWLAKSARQPEYPPPLPVTEGDVAWARENVPYEPKKYVVIVQRSGYWPRNWPDDRSNRVAQWLDMQGIPTVMVGLHGSPPAIEDYEFKHLTNLLGKGTLAQVAAVICDARLVVTPDTGLMHLACGYKVPTVALFGPSEYSYLTKLPVTPIHRKDSGCIECYAKHEFYKACNGRVDCMKNITTTRVIEEIANRLCIQPHRGWKRPTISLCMMVKNEMQMLPGALESARAFADEIVVVDTGSTDGTREWIAEQPYVEDHVFDVGEQIQSFSEVRNFAYSKATGKYVAWMDACERLKDPAGLRSIVLDEQCDCYALKIAHGTLEYTREKIMPRVFARFMDRIHEFMDTSGLWDGTVLPQYGIERLYYEKQNREFSESRNIRLLKLQLEEKPENPRAARWLYYLARDLCDAKRYEEALPYLQRRVALEGFWEERYAAAILLSRLYLYETKDFVRARKTAEAMINLVASRREGLYCLAESSYWNSEFEKARDVYLKCIQIPRPRDATMWLWEEAYTWLPLDRLSRVHEYLGNRDDAIEWAKKCLGAAPQSEHGWIVERVKALSGVQTLAGAMEC